MQNLDMLNMHHGWSQETDCPKNGQIDGPIFWSVYQYWSMYAIQSENVYPSSTDKSPNVW